MELLLDKLKPLTLQTQDSEIWTNRVSWKKGSFIHINAPSGTGKTTLIHFLYGLRFDYEGDLQIGPHTATGLELDTWSQIRSTELSVVFQDLRLFPALTALENIQLKSTLTGHSSDEEIHEMASLLGIESKMNQAALTLSQGEKQRVAIIRGLVQPFSWLFMDEPFSHLDDKNIARAGELILKKCRDNSAGYVLASLGLDYGLPFDQKYNL